MPNAELLKSPVQGPISRASVKVDESVDFVDLKERSPFGDRIDRLKRVSGRASDQNPGVSIRSPDGTSFKVDNVDDPEIRISGWKLSICIAIIVPTSQIVIAGH